MYRKNILKEEVVTSEVLKKSGLFENDKLVVEKYNFKPGQDFTLHRHPSGTQVIFVFKGEGEFFIQKENEEKQKLYISEGAVIFLEEGVWHGVKNTGNVNLIVAQVTTANAGMETK